MTLTLVVLDEALEEAEAQGRFYARHAGEAVALRFVAAIESVFFALAERRVVGTNHPHARFRIPVKRVLLDRFPFAVVFTIEGDVATIVALESLRRRPGYWRARLRAR